MLEELIGVVDIQHKFDCSPPLSEREQVLVNAVKYWHAICSATSHNGNKPAQDVLEEGGTYSVLFEVSLRKKIENLKDSLAIALHTPPESVHIVAVSEALVQSVTYSDIKLKKSHFLNPLVR